jgi:hypothetical protein
VSRSLVDRLFAQEIQLCNVPQPEVPNT